MTSTQALPAGVQEWFSAPDFKTCYPYFVLWTDLVLGRAWMPAMPSMPTLFIYGTRKRMRFPVWKSNFAVHLSTAQS